MFLVITVEECGNTRLKRQNTITKIKAETHDKNSPAHLVCTALNTPNVSRHFRSTAGVIAVVCGVMERWDEKTDDVWTFPGSQVHTAIVEIIALFLVWRDNIFVFRTHIGPVWKQACCFVKETDRITRNAITGSWWGIIFRLLDAVE